jgi:C2 domain
MDNCNPIYNDDFEYVMSEGELHGRKLEVSVVSNKKSMFASNPLMGQVRRFKLANTLLAIPLIFNPQVVIDLSELDLTQQVTDWYNLTA